MSHVVNMDIEVRDLESLRAACVRLGWEFVEGQNTYEWFGRWVGDYPLPEGTRVEDLGHCDHAIKVPGAEYEIGVVRKGDQWLLRWDFFDMSLKLAVGGQTAPKLAQAYGVEHSRRTLQRKGYRVVGEQTLSDGSIRLRVEGR